MQIRRHRYLLLQQKDEPRKTRTTGPETMVVVAMALRLLCSRSLGKKEEDRFSSETREEMKIQGRWRGRGDGDEEKKKSFYDRVGCKDQRIKELQGAIAEMKEKMALLKEKFSKEELSKLEDALGSRTNSHERVRRHFLINLHSSLMGHEDLDGGGRRRRGSYVL
ncbi:hypothetical protein Bca52824_024208 [Brassica carinata]|uniref:Uncharacterized protein n=1 Tax=Brassica carinata TaxID=52824 RepID=A0A8X7VK11_BRACI|nr:hypothetical protein Bca52824_024208 [Brassica carinata]